MVSGAGALHKLIQDLNLVRDDPLSPGNSLTRISKTGLIIGLLTPPIR